MFKKFIQKSLFSKAMIGLKAPKFAGDAYFNGHTKIKSKNYKGKYLVLFFYPLDFTFVCPTEIIEFSGRLKEFKELDAEVVGCSACSQYSKEAWTNLTRKQGGLGQIDYPLLADPTHKISKDYGVYLPELGYPLRGTFIIDRKQVLRHISHNDLPVGRNIDEVLRLIKGFKYYEETGENLPCSWKPGKATINVDDPDDLGEFFEEVFYNKNKGITSNVIFETKGWYDMALLIPHEPMRRGLNDLVDMIHSKHFEADVKNNMVIFKKWYKDIFYDFFYQHHKDEDDIYFPWLSQKVKIPKIFHSEHEDILTLMDEIKDSTDIRSLRLNCKKLRRLTNLHLDTEEEFVPKFLKENFTEQEEGQTVQRIIASFDPQTIMLMVPYAMDVMKEWAGEEYATKFLEKVFPPKVIELYHKVWYPQYIKNNVDVKNKLIYGSK